MSSTQGHKTSGSVSQNHKAQLANAYNELGKELSSTKIRVVGNYTLGKVIGEGEPPNGIYDSCLIPWQERMVRYEWGRTA